MKQKTPRTVELDVRPYLHKKMEPFQLIMDQVKSLEVEDTFVLHATFKPTPLLGVMKMRGYVNKTRQIDKDHWIVTFVNKKNKKALETFESDAQDIEDIQNRQEALKVNAKKTIELDNRGLEPPQPMIRTLSALEKSQSGDEIIIHNDRVPVFLIEELNILGYPFKIEDQADGSARVIIQKR